MAGEKLFSADLEREEDPVFEFRQVTFNMRYEGVNYPFAPYTSTSSSDSRE